MSILCCCRGQQKTTREFDQDTLELPTHPPRAKLPTSSFPTTELAICSPHIVATQAPSLLYDEIPEATVDPTAIEIEDSDDDDPVRNPRDSGAGTLGAIRTRFIRPLSQKSEPKRHSQRSFGSSDEEVARRAELKHLMHKRIQEELKSEAEQEEADEKTNNFDEPKPESSSIALHGGGPRDHIEFSVADANEIGPGDFRQGSEDIVFLALPPSDSLPAISLRRSSCPDTPSRSHGNSISESNKQIREHGSLPQLPSSPQLVPLQLPSARGSESLCSWRLSCSAEQLASYLGLHDDLRPKDTEYSASDTPSENVGKDDERYEDCIDRHSINNQTSIKDQHHITSTHDQEQDLNNTESLGRPSAEDSHDTSSGPNSPLNLWLRSQEMHSASVVSSKRTSDIITRMSSQHTNSDGLSRRGEGVKVFESPTSCAENASEALSVIQDDLLELPSTAHSTHGDGDPPLEELISPWPDELQYPINYPHDSPDNQGRDSAEQVREASSHYDSSRYTTRPNSCQATTKESHLSLIELLSGRRAYQPFSNFNLGLLSPSRTTVAEKSDNSSYKTAPNEASTLDITTSQLRHLRRPTVETCSVAISDTPSFKHRESELKSIEKRFGQVLARRDNTSPMTSRFKEEFNEARTTAIAKNSILAKLHLPISKRTRHATRGVPRQTMHGTNQDSVDQVYAKDPDERRFATGLEQPAMALDEGASHTPIHQPDPSPGHLYQDDTQIGEDVLSYDTKPEATVPDQSRLRGKNLCAADISGSKPNEEKKATLQPPPRVEDSSSQQSNISNNVLREWVNLMNDQDSLPQPESKMESQSRAARRFRTPPASWAKWPSHTRSERTGPAGKDDDVIPRDFAVRIASQGSGTTWSTDKPGDSPKRYISTGTRSLSAQWGRAVKEGLNKMVQSTLNRSPSETRRNRQRRDGDLEYPELEILPMHGSYKELQALEQQIDTMKRGSVPAESQMARLEAGSARPPLSARLAEEVHKIQHKLSKGSCQGDEETVLASTAGGPMTPKPALLSLQGSSGVSRTPKSQISYEDCVPKHMLEDEQSTEGEPKVSEGGYHGKATRR
ncbi:hypothetical protein M426DRAFT_14908 [Hypoxylon sp. CI-4A]|nr:hypothetical protein M426DRAFT_14908 [Hypoxylon sp. CI-4A]